MKLNRTGSNWTRTERNKINENWDILEGSYNDVAGEITDEVFKEIVDSARLDWKLPVDSFGDLPSEAGVGDTRMVRDTGKVYRFDGNSWNEIQDRDPTAINEIDDRLTKQLAEKATKKEVSEIDNNKADKIALAQGLSSKRDKNVEIGMADLDQEVRESFTGGSIPVVGEDSVGNVNLRSDAVTRDKMANNYAINYPYLSDETFDLDYIWKQGNYIVNALVKNNPTGSGCTLTVDRFKTSDGNANLWVVQTVTAYSSGSEYRGESLRRIMT